MESPPKKSDFVLTPYMQSNDLRATYQTLITLVPYALLWALAAPASAVSPWLLLPITALMTLFLVRCFSLMHDCGHYSLFRRKRANRAVGFILGVINAIPQYPWSRGHAYHHKTNGDWERYRGPSALITTREFNRLSRRGQWGYAALRHPLMVFPGGFFYLAIKPRLALILGSLGFAGHLLKSLRHDPSTGWGEIFATYKSRNWYTTGEFWDLLFNNLCVIGSWVVMARLLGAGLFFGVYFSTLTVAAAIFICVFFVQHNFEDSYAHGSEGWSYLRGALEGSSYLELPPIIKWFSMDIGYHNIHHLSERIPNYNLEACHRQNSHLLGQVKKLQLSDIPNCFKFILWDAEAEQLVSIASQRAKSSVTLAAETPAA